MGLAVTEITSIATLALAVLILAVQFGWRGGRLESRVGATGPQGEKGETGPPGHDGILDMQGSLTLGELNRQIADLHKKASNYGDTMEKAVGRWERHCGHVRENADRRYQELMRQVAVNQTELKNLRHELNGTLRRPPAE